jgi:hypothetical protein
MKTPTQTLAAALRQLANDIESPDGVANAAIAEAAERLEELTAQAEVLRREFQDARKTLQTIAGCTWDSGAEEIADVALDEAKRWVSRYDDSVLKSTHEQCLREIQAEAGRAGFVAGADSYFDRHYDKSVSDEVLLSADKYANRIRKGGE